LIKLTEENFIVFKDVFNNVDYKFDEYNVCYGRYVGCGNNLYLLVKEDQNDEILMLCNTRCRINPKIIAEWIGKKLKDFRLVMIDKEMGSINVFDQNGYLQRKQELI
jgi:hypothetical protein